MSVASRLRIVVLGYVIRGPLGGMAWHHLNYVLGLRELGHDVYFVEDSDDEPCCYDPSRGYSSEDPSYGLGFAERTFARLGLATGGPITTATPAPGRGRARPTAPSSAGPPISSSTCPASIRCASGSRRFPPEF